MFKITFLVDDRNLAGVLRDLSGRVRNMEPPVPVANAEPDKNGAIKAKANGNLVDLFIKGLMKSKLEQIPPAQAKNFLKAHGRSPLSSSYLLAGAVKAGVLKKRGKGNATFYLINRSNKR